MPEGPTIVLLKEETRSFKNKKILEVEGNVKTIHKEILLDQKIIDIKSWGKHFLICFKGFTIKIHFLMFGSYLINGEKSTPVRLGLTFANGTINFYSCMVKLLEGNINDHYDWSSDVMNETWDEKKALKKLKDKPNTLACDALLDQDIFGGVGNIIKNEVLYRVKVNPKSKVGKIPPAKLKEMISEASIYSFQFLEWKRKFELKKHWLAHTKKTCERCDLPLIKEYLGVTNRRTFYCKNCQKLYK